MNILGLDTSSPQDTAIGIYVSPDEHLCVSLHLKRSQESKLLATIDNALESLQLSLQDIDLIAVGLGPGSFTGLRIGISTARALAWSRNIPLIGIPSLDLLAAGHPSYADPDHLIVACVDAHMQKVFSRIYKGGKALSEPQDISPQALTEALQARTEAHISIMGNGLRKYPALAALEGKTVNALPQACIDGISLCLQARALYDPEHIPPLDEVHPLYLRKSEAEKSLEARQK